MSDDAIKNALRLARRKKNPVRFHHTIAREGYATDGAVTPQAKEEPEAQAYGEVSFAPEYMPRPSQEVRPPDEAKQEAFIREELKGSAPQYDPSAETGLKNAAIAGAKWTAPGAAADAMGMLGGPSMAENIRQGRYLPAALQAVAVGLPTAMAGRAAINAGLGAGASKFTKLGKPDVFLAPGYVAEQTAEDWAPGVFGKEAYEGAKAAGKKALEEGAEYVRRKIGYSNGGEVEHALRLAQVARENSDQLPLRMNYGVRHGSNDLKDIGFLGPLRQGPDKITEYSSEKDFQYPSVYEGITPKDLAAVMFHERITSPKYRGEDIISERLNEAEEKKPVSEKIPFPEDVDDRAYAAAQRRVQEGRSPFYEPGRDPYPKWSPAQEWDEPAMKAFGGSAYAANVGEIPMSSGGEVEDALRLAYKSGGGAWTRKEGKNPEGGLNAKGRASAKREGMNLKPPAPHPKTEKDAGRRKSFCSRMKGMKAKLTSAETARDPDSRINKSLRAWNCADGGAVENALKLAKGGEIWDKNRPKGLGTPKKLSESQKSSAKAAAKAAGRPWPNMIDNINAAKKR